MYFVVGALLLRAIDPQLHPANSTLNDPERGRKSEKHKETSYGSDDEADDDRAWY